MTVCGNLQDSEGGVRLAPWIFLYLLTQRPSFAQLSWLGLN